MDCDHCGDHRVHQAFAGFIAVAVQNSRVYHQMTDIADQHQGAAFEHDLVALNASKTDVVVQDALVGFAAFGHGFSQRALHQPKPIGVGHDLIGAINSRDRIFAIHNDGQRAFQHDVGDACFISFANIRFRIDDDTNQQAIRAQKHIRQTCVISVATNKLLRVL